MDVLQRKTPFLIAGKVTVLHACIVIALVAIAVAMRAVGLNGRFDFDGYDEGVYWQTLRAMSGGYHLYGQIFFSQPPLFLLSIYPFYALLGSTIVSARIGVAALSLLGLLGAYLMGTALSGRLGGLAAVVILMVTPIYLAQSQALEAEGPATAFLFLTVGAAFLWHERPTGRRAMVFAVICGMTLSLGILLKLLDAIAVIPIVLLVAANIWHVRHETRPCFWANLLPIAAGLVAAVVAALIVSAPFLGSLNALLQQTVTFHLAAEKVQIFPPSIERLGGFFATNGVLCAVAMIGVIVAILRRDGRIVPLAGWLLATVIVLAIHAPVFQRHTLVLVPPLIAIIALGLNDLPAVTISRPIAWRYRAALLMGSLAAATVLVSIRADYDHYRDLNALAASPATQWIAAELDRVTAREQWGITDAQFVAALANRETPPWLTDTSLMRIGSGFLTSGELLQTAADLRVHAVLFANGHFTAAPVAGFHDWVADHFSLTQRYGNGVELWTR